MVQSWGENVGSGELFGESSQVIVLWCDDAIGEVKKALDSVYEMRMSKLRTCNLERLFLYVKLVNHDHLTPRKPPSPWYGLQSA